MQELPYKILVYLLLFSCFVLILFYIYTQQEVWCHQAPKAKFRWERWQHANCEASSGLLVANKELLPVIAFWDATNDLLEYEWVFNVLLAKVERPIFIVRSEEELEAASQGLDTLNLLYITSEYRKFRPTSFFDDDGLKRLRQKWGQQLWLGYMHLSDEHLDSVKGYDVANYVYRNYWNWEMEENIREVIRTSNPGLKVEWMILGFSNIRPFSPGLLLPASMRSIVCNFYGSPNRGNRPQLAAALAKEPGILKAPSGEQVKCDTGLANLDQRNYWERLQRSVFTLCPSGNGDETYRLAETLTNGGIPITVATYYSQRFLSEAPFFQLESWDNINEFITQQLALAHANSTYLDGLQADVARWWHNYIGQLQSQIAADVVKS